MPEGDTVWRTCRRLNDVLAGRELTRSRVPGAGPGHHRPDRRRRTRGGLPRQASALPVRQRASRCTPTSGWTAPGGSTRAAAAGAVDRTSRSGRCWPPSDTMRRISAAGDRADPDRGRGHRRRPSRTRPARRRLGPGRGRTPDREPNRTRTHRRGAAGPAQPGRHRHLLPRRTAVPAGHPPAHAGAGRSANLRRVVQRGQQLLLANRWRPEQSTTGDLRPGRRAYVFERPGQPCRRCGTPIQTEEFGPAGQERRSYWCPHCQPSA